MTRAKDLTRSIAQRLGFLDPVRAFASEVVRVERQIARANVKIDELTRNVEAMDARLLDRRADMARLHHTARKAARGGADGRALRLLADKRSLESSLHDLEEEVTAGRKLLKLATGRRDAMVHALDDLRRAFEASNVVRLTGDVVRGTRPPAGTRRLERARQKLMHAEALADLDAPDDPFLALPELAPEDDRLLVARWRSEDRVAA